MKKTKKEKMLADLRRKIAQVEYKVVENQPAQKKEDIKPAAFVIPQYKTKTLSLDYSQIYRDLRKTLLLSGFIAVILLILKFLLKV